MFDFLGTFSSNFWSKLKGFLQDKFSSEKEAIASHLDHEASRFRAYLDKIQAAKKKRGSGDGDVEWKVAGKPPETAVKTSGARRDGDVAIHVEDLVRPAIPALRYVHETLEYEAKLVADFVERAERQAVVTRQWDGLNKQASEVDSLFASGQHKENLFSDSEPSPVLSSLDAIFGEGQVPSSGTGPGPGKDLETGVSASVFSPPSVLGGISVEGVPVNPGPGQVLPSIPRNLVQGTKGLPGVYQGSIKLQDGSVQLTDGSIQRPDGSILQIDGTILNLDGSVLYPDGRTVYVDGSVKYPDGLIRYPDGSVKYPDGSIAANGLRTFSDGRIRRGDGAIYNPATGETLYSDGSHRFKDGSFKTVEGCWFRLDGTVVWSDGSVVTPDCRVLRPNGEVWYPNGDVLLPSGNVRHPDGSVTDPSGTQIEPPTEGCVRQVGDCEKCPDRNSVRCYKRIRCFPQGCDGGQYP
jgi:hypothetical protein